MLGATLDNKPHFATHLLNISKNANKKFNALTQVQNYVATNQKKLIFALLSRNLPIVCCYGCFVQDVPFAE